MGAEVVLEPLLQVCQMIGRLPGEDTSKRSLESASVSCLHAISQSLEEANPMLCALTDLSNKDLACISRVAQAGAPVRPGDQG